MCGCHIYKIWGQKKMRHECYFCHIKTIEKLIEKFKPDERVAEQFIFSVHARISAGREAANPLLATEIHRIARRYLVHGNLYAEEKQIANTTLLAKFSHWKALVKNSPDPFHTAARLAVAGNIIDYGAHSVGQDISGQIETLAGKDLAIDMTEKLKNEIDKAETVLYLGDNCGEIVFDRLFIEEIGHPNVIFAARGAPVINDATLEDARQVGMDKTCRLVSNGADAPSTILDLCSDEFREIFHTADLVISKGQGNFEGLMNSRHPNIFFLLIAKCRPIAGMLGVKINDMVVSKAYMKLGNDF